MADNVSVTPGSGVTIGTRDTGGGVEIQRVIPNTWNGTSATDVSATNPLPNTGTLKDGISSNLATIAQFHNADNQNPGGAAFGLLTGGVAQLLNVAGNIDRQRETGTDNIPAQGIPTGTQQLASAFSTTIAASVTTGTQTVTPAAMSGTSRGAAWAIKVGSVLTVANSNGTNSETVVVVAVAPTTFTAAFASTKTGPGITVQGFAYNQARDATTADGSTGQGFAAGATFLYNSALNSGAGGWESERSAAGELDGATGVGTAVAAEYESNSGGPPLQSGLASGLQYDRGRNVQGKGLATATITAPAAAATSIVVPTPAQVNLLQPGAPLYLVAAGAIVETVYVSQTYTPGTSPVALQNAVVTGGETTAWFDVYAPAGPGLSGFTPSGVEISEEALWDPVSGKFYLARSATADALAAANVVAESPVLWNGATLDRLRSASAANIAATSGVGAELHAGPGQWSINSTPATNTQATASKAAGGAGVRHVATSITATLAAGATAITAAAPLLVNLRDGATGAGTILWSTYINVPATAAQSTTITLSALNIVGSANTALTLEFAAAGGTNSFESVALTGYEVQ